MISNVTRFLTDHYLLVVSIIQFLVVFSFSAAGFCKLFVVLNMSDRLKAMDKPLPSLYFLFVITLWTTVVHLWCVHESKDTTFVLTCIVSIAAVVVALVVVCLQASPRGQYDDC